MPIISRRPYHIDATLLAIAEAPHDVMFNYETDIIARIESLELDIRAIHRRLEHTANLADKRVLNQQIGELTAEIARLKERITPRPPRLTPIKPA